MTFPAHHNVSDARVIKRAAPPATSLSTVIEEAFPRASAETRRMLTMSAKVGTYAGGRLILRQGDESSLALILQGHVATRRTTVDGRELIVALVGPGGLASVLPLAGRPLAADVVALAETEAAVWRGQKVRSLIEADPGFGADILDAVLLRFEQLVGRLDSMVHQDALRRVARVLCLHADWFFAEPVLLTRAHLPSLVGTSREMTGRVLRVLESRRIVARVGRDGLRLLDPAALAAAAGPDIEGAWATRRGA
jgi:CRP/FNR family transcriptional regulator